MIARTPPSPEAILLQGYLQREQTLDGYFSVVRPVPLGTGGLLVACLAWHLLPVLYGAPLLGSRDPELLGFLGARVRDEVATGAVWRLLSPLFLHGGGLHLGLNLLALWLLGRICEALYGPSRFLFLFLASGLGGSVLSQAIGAPLSVGASGAIFGLLGAAACFGLRRHALLHQDLRPFLGRALVPWIAANLVLGLLIPGIDNAGHIGGLLTGGLLGLGLQDRILAGSHQSGVRGRALGLVSVLVLLATFVSMLRSTIPAIAP